MGTRTAFRSASLRAAVLTVVLVVTAAAATVLAPAATAVYPPTFESVVAGDGDHIDATTALALGAEASRLYSCGSLWHEATGYDITVSFYGYAREAEEGDELPWTTTWDSATSEDDTAVDIVVGWDDTIYVYGSEDSGPDARPVLLHFDADGQLLWAVHRPGGEARQLVMGDTNLYALCVEDNEDAGGSRVVVTAYQPDGMVAWEAKYQTRSYKAEMAPADMCLRPGDRVYVCGSVTGPDLGTRAFLARFAAGRKTWSRLYDGPGRKGASFSAVAPSPVGGVFAVGRARSDAYDILVTRYNPSGTRRLTRRLGVGDGHRQWATDVAVDSLGRLAICGGWRVSNKGFYVALLSRAGKPVWSHNYAGDKTYGYAKKIVVSTNDRVCVAGNTRGTRDAAGTYRRGRVATYAFTKAGRLGWSCRWPATYTPSTAFHQLEALDIAVWQWTYLWVCGSSDDRADTGPDQFVISWRLPGPHPR